MIYQRKDKFECLSSGRTVTEAILKVKFRADYEFFWRTNKSYLDHGLEFIFMRK